VLSLLLRFTDSDYPFGIFKLFLTPFKLGLEFIYIFDLNKLDTFLFSNNVKLYTIIKCKLFRKICRSVYIVFLIV